ncbi:MAG: beta-propeller domain-containing protein [Verrucomicrobiota bacterium]
MIPRLFACLAALMVMHGLSPLSAVPPPDPAAPTALTTAPVTLRFTVKGLVVTAALERGVYQAVLEQKSGDGWKPVAVAYSTLRTGRVTFKLPTVMNAANLRVQGYRSAKFPARFLYGKRSFERKDLSGTDAGSLILTTNSVVRSISAPNLAFTNSLTGTTAASALAVSDLSPTAVPDTVLESDIWQIVGNQMYFFNHYRGLQILDLTDPTLPVRTGSLRLPASGEQMIVVDEAGTQVALLGTSSDRDHAGAATVWLIRVTDGIPVMTAEVPLEGTMLDSRLVGTTLHVLSKIQPIATNSHDGHGTAVLTSIDLSNLDVPKKLGRLTFPAQSAVLQISAGCALVGTTNYVSNNMYPNRAVHLVDVSKAPRLVKTFTPRGLIQDKFKLGIVNGSVVTVSIEGEWSGRRTWVETFPITGSDVAALSQLELEGARGEVLHATRFDGDRLYVVTFRQIDPLFIVDLADPAAPVLSGVLEVPGWSTYLEPLGDRLLAVGTESGFTTVSLFDVSDVTTPALLSRLRLGGNYGSTSEANTDEKAIEYLADEGILMVPFQSWDNSGTQRGVQVVNVGAEELTAGPTIEHDFDPRRGSFISGHYVSISGHELLVHGTDAEASDAPVVSLPLAWRADRVVPVGGYLVQIEDGLAPFSGRLLTLNGYYPPSYDAHAKLRITSTTDPDALEQVIDLGAGPIVGITQRGDRLFLAQQTRQQLSTLGNYSPALRTVALHLSSTTPVVTQVDEATHDLGALGLAYLNTDEVQPLWIDDEKLVWHIPLGNPLRLTAGPIINGPIFIGTPIVALPGIIARPIFLPVIQPVAFPTTGLILNGTSTLAAPPPPTPEPAPGVPAAIFCPVGLEAGNGTLNANTAQVVRVRGNVRGSSRAFTQNGFIFFSYDTVVEKPTTLATIAVSSAASFSRAPVAKISVPYRPQEVRLASWLQVIDWNANAPVLRDPVSIPGPLLSVAQADAQGAVVLTNSDQQISKTAAPTRVIQASAYDGVSAWQLDSYITSTPYHSATATDGLRLYLGREVGIIGVVGVGYNAITGRLSQINSWATAETPTMLHAIPGHLLASSAGNLEVASITASTGVLKPVASFDTPTNLWLRVDRSALTPSQDLWIPAGEFGVEFLQRGALTP